MLCLFSDSRNMLQYVHAEKVCPKFTRKAANLATLHLGVRCEMLYSYSDCISKTSQTRPLTNTGTKIWRKFIRSENPKHKVGGRIVSALELGDHYLSGCKAFHYTVEQGPGINDNQVAGGPKRLKEWEVWSEGSQSPQSPCHTSMGAFFFSGLSTQDGRCRHTEEYIIIPPWRKELWLPHLQKPFLKGIRDVFAMNAVQVDLHSGTTLNQVAGLKQTKNGIPFKNLCHCLTESY